MKEKVDTWRGGKRLNVKEESVSRSVLPTVELGGPGVLQTTLPVNVLAEEGDDVDDPEEEVQEDDVAEISMAIPTSFASFFVVGIA